MHESTQALEGQWHVAHERYDYAQSDRIARQVAAKLRIAARRANTEGESERLRLQALWWDAAATEEQG